MLCNGSAVDRSKCDDVVKTDIVIKENHSTYAAAEMKAVMLQSQAIEVSAGYFADKQDHPASMVHFSHDEIH